MALSLGQFWGSPQEMDFIFSLPLSFSCCSVTQSHLTLYDPMGFRRPGFPALYRLPELAQTHIHRVDDATQPFDPLSSLSPPALNLSQYQGLFQWVSSSHQMAKYWSFSFSISPSNEYSGLISFRMDWLDLLAVQGTLKSLLQEFKSINSSALRFVYHPTLTSIHDYYTWSHECVFRGL